MNCTRGFSGELTVVATGDTSAGLARRTGAGIFLQTRVGNATRAGGDRAAVVLTSGQGEVARQCRNDGGQTEKTSCEREVHVVGLKREIKILFKIGPTSGIFL